jgi:hypothetical protein
MGPDDALLIFPEGGNFTEDAAPPDRQVAGRRRRAAIARRTCSTPASARGWRASPSPAPTSCGRDTGLDRSRMRTIWREIPPDKTLYVGWQVHAGSSVPTSVAELSTWLFDRWDEVDV